MRSDDERLGVVREWVARAEDDFKTATGLLKSVKDAPPSSICFHAQQCIEKYLKAHLVWQRRDFAKIHDIGELLARLGTQAGVTLTVVEQRRLTWYATSGRYPGHYEPISPKEARAAVALARKLRAATRKALPTAAIRPRG